MAVQTPIDRMCGAFHQIYQLADKMICEDDSDMLGDLFEIRDLAYEQAGEPQDER